jgi:hypothetical protein
MGFAWVVAWQSLRRRFAGAVHASAQRQDDVVPVPRSRVVARADLLPAVRVFLLVALTGVPLGLVWSLLAPPQHRRVSGDGTPVPLLADTYHAFDPSAIFLLASFGAGLLSGIGVWLVRSRRGPVMLLGAVLGSLIAAALAIQAGAWFVAVQYPLPPAPKPGVLISVAPSVNSWWAVVAAPLGVAISYGLAASWNGLDDLGRGPTSEESAATSSSD